MDVEGQKERTLNRPIGAGWVDNKKNFGPHTEFEAIRKIFAGLVHQVNTKYARGGGGLDVRWKMAVCTADQAFQLAHEERHAAAALVRFHSGVPLLLGWRLL